WKASASKKGISGLHLSRELDLNLRSALSLLNRVQLRMAEWLPQSGDGDEPTPFDELGADGSTLEADETYVGERPRPAEPARVAAMDEFDPNHDPTDFEYWRPRP